MKPSTRGRQRGGRWKALLVGIVLALLLAELCLQGIAYVVYRANRRPAPGLDGDNAAAVLCVGDSFTFGLGASRGHDYPSRLEEMLGGESEPARRVVNAGWPGQTSADVLLRLQDQLDQARPQVVCVLVGVNDFALPPVRVEAAAEDRPAGAEGRQFPIRCRLLLFARQLPMVWSGGPAYSRKNTTMQDPAPPFVGTWHLAHYELDILPNGRTLLGGHPFASWKLRDGRLFLSNGVGIADEHDTDWRLDDGRLTLSMPGFGRVQLSPGPATLLSDLQRARIAAKKGQTEVALALYESAFADPDPAQAAAARGAAIEDLLALDRRQDAERHLAWLREQHGAATAVGPGQGQDPGQAAIAEHLLRSSILFGAADEALALTSSILAAAPRDESMWMRLADLSHDPRHHGLLQQVLGLVLTAPDLDAATRRHLLVLHFRYLFDQSPAAAVRQILLVAAHADDDYLSSLLRRGNLDATALERHCVELGASPEQQQRLLALTGGESGGRATLLANLRHHLQRITELCRDSGATPILLHYPFRLALHEDVIAELAAANHLKMVPLHLHFEALLKRHRWESLFVADGHCNEVGYLEMAREIARTVQPLLRTGR